LRGQKSSHEHHEGVTAAYPFEVLSDPESLATRLWATTKDSTLADHEIPYLRRLGPEVDEKFHTRGRVLLSGRSKAGKTREALELLRRNWTPDTTVLRLRSGAWLDAPLRLPDGNELPYKRIVLLIDDVDHFCRVQNPVSRSDMQKSPRVSFPVRLQWFVSYYARLLGSAHELRIVATVRSESPYWDQIHYSPYEEPWSQFALIEVPTLNTGESEMVVRTLSQTSEIAVDESTGHRLATKNEGNSSAPETGNQRKS